MKITNLPLPWMIAWSCDDDDDDGQVEFVFPDLPASSSFSNNTKIPRQAQACPPRIKNEMMDFKKKYDDLVTYTVSRLLGSSSSSSCEERRGVEDDGTD